MRRVRPDNDLSEVHKDDADAGQGRPKETDFYTQCLYDNCVNGDPFPDTDP